MTALSQLILESYQTRKTKKQKAAFISLLQKHFPDLKVQEGGFPKSKNLIIGDVESAKVLLTAHYDTCARLLFPNFITPKKPVLVILYSLLMILPLFIAVFVLNLLLSLITDNYWAHYLLSLISYFGILFLMLAGPANTHTANDNTSGVILLCELLTQMSPEDRAKTAFVFFDNEESGLLGSSCFRKHYKKQLQNKLIINFDCISDGDYILVAANKSAYKDYGTTLVEFFCNKGNKQMLHEKLERIYYPSDQAGFKNAIAVASLKHNRFLGYYMDKIHTKADTVFDEENIRLLSTCTQEFIKKIVI